MRALALTALFACVAACHLDYAGGARPISSADLQAATWVRAAPTPVVRQLAETDCGLAALAMVAGAWGHTWGMGDLTHRLRPDDAGVSLGKLRDLARARGLDAFAIAGTHADLEHELAAGRPVLLGLVLPFDRQHNRSHYEVAIALDKRDGSVVTIDPASGDMLRRTSQVLDLEWKTAGYAALVVVGDHSAARKEAML
jgi:ABC-type bacteriocin/lantibiotic exporter with double-glycine peptidase domain